MNKHVIFVIIGLLIVAVFIVTAMGFNQAEAPLVNETSIPEVDSPEIVSSTTPTDVRTPEDAPLPAPTPSPTSKPITANPEPARGCMVTGCSSQLCVEEGQDMATTCEWREQYACYQTATCERQATGECGWTDTLALQQCLVVAEGEMQIELQN